MFNTYHWHVHIIWHIWSQALSPTQLVDSIIALGSSSKQTTIFTSHHGFKLQASKSLEFQHFNTVMKYIPRCLQQLLSCWVVSGRFDSSKFIVRKVRGNTGKTYYFGLVQSSNQLLRHTVKRDDMKYLILTAMTWWSHGTLKAYDHYYRRPSCASG